MATKNYTSLYRIKEFLMTEMAPKYLAAEEINIAQVGLFGYITETLSVLGEDGLNSTSIVFKECFANAAENIESLYLMAAVYQLDSYFASAASMPFIVILNEEDILDNGTNVNGMIQFYIDKNTQFVIDDMRFMLEYDIKITTKNTKDGYIHTAQYVMDNKLSFSTITNQYIRTKTLKYNRENFVALLVELRQMESREYEEIITSNDKINFCSFDFDLGEEVMIAGFEAFYQAPSATANEVQLIKKMENTPKESDPFCFYTMPDEGTLRISFSNDDRFFVPEFNSTIRVVIYTTDGAKGNFNSYTGDNISIITTAERYNENNGLILFGQCSGNSRGGKNSPTMEEFRDMVVAAQSTVLSYTTDNDLALYFKKMVNAGNTRIMFMKRRDDSLIRLFNAFTLLTDANNVIIPTNTCDLMIAEDGIDEYYPETYRCVVKAGKIYRYSDTFKGSLEVDNSMSMYDKLDNYEDDFIYTNPFLMIMSSRPVNVGMYMNSVDEVIHMDTENVNQNSFVQFMVSGLSVYRNAILGEDDYKFTINLLPTTTDIETCVTEIKDDTRVLASDRVILNDYDGKRYIDNNRIKVIMVFTDKGTETCYIEFDLKGFTDQYYIFEGKIKTDDFVSSNNKMRVLHTVKHIVTNEDLEEKYIPSSNLTVNLYTFYRYDSQDNEDHKYTARGIAKNYTLTNKYTTNTNKMDLIKPLNMIRSHLSYNQFINLEGNSDYNYRVASVPMVKANYVKNPETFNKFISNITAIYEYLNAEIDKLTNNFSIDIKFYNTYGKSRHYAVDATVDELGLSEIKNASFIDPNDDSEDATGKIYINPNKIFEFEELQDGRVYLDTINIRLKFAIKPYYTTDIENLLKDIKEYILNYLRSEFDNYGNNAYYNSNLMRSLENDFRDKIEYIIFKGINNYPLEIQKLEPIVNAENIQEYYDAMLDYVPEYVNVYYKMTDGISEPMIEIEVL